MSIPNFKSQEDWEEFTSLFDARWHCKKALLDRVKDDMYGRPGFASPEWSSLPPHSVETINDIVQSLLYDVEWTFKEKYPEYKTDDDECFIPRRSFKEDVTEALLEANNKFWNSANESTAWAHPSSGIHPNNPSDPIHGCPPCDTLACVDHLTDE